MLNVPEAAAYLGIERKTFYAWRRTGEMADITHWTPTGRPYWFPDELDKWLRSRWSGLNPPVPTEAAEE